MSHQKDHGILRYSGRFLALGLLAGVFSTVGCASLIGVEDGEWDGNVVDAVTKIRTSDLCVSYCDEVMKNCAGENAVYQSRAACVNTCNNLPTGDAAAAEPKVNTVQCRYDQAKSAKEFPADACPSAGPGGAGDCGTNCESWCILLEAACQDEYDELATCEESCRAIPSAPGFNVASGYGADANNIQCRISHLGAALADENAAVTHCPHTQFTAVGACDGEGEPSGEPTCESYCQTAMGACFDTNQQYQDATECGVACFLLDVGTTDDTKENTVGCRSYHAGNALKTPDTHCPHAGPTGDGHCGSPCEAYCTMFDGACGAEFPDFATPAACVGACEASGLPGIEADSGYNFATAFDTDSLQCRIRSVIFAKSSGVPTEVTARCENARLSGTCAAP